MNGKYYDVDVYDHIDAIRKIANKEFRSFIDEKWEMLIMHMNPVSVLQTKANILNGIITRLHVIMQNIISWKDSIKRVYVE